MVIRRASRISRGNALSDISKREILTRRAADANALARLDSGISAWRAGWRDHFFLVSSIWVWRLSVNFFVAGWRRLMTPLRGTIGWLGWPASSAPGGSLP
jgi:hypothetical protein